MYIGAGVGWQRRCKTCQSLRQLDNQALNVGAIVILPEGFKLAPKNLISKELKEKTKKQKQRAKACASKKKHNRINSTAHFV